MSWRIVVYSLLLGAVTSGVIGMADVYVPNSQVKRAVIDALAMPGAMLASLFFGEGPHTGGGVPYWGWAVLVMNYVVYSSVWLAMLLLLHWWRR